VTLAVDSIAAAVDAIGTVAAVAAVAVRSEKFPAENRNWASEESAVFAASATRNDRLFVGDVIVKNRIKLRSVKIQIATQRVS